MKKKLRLYARFLVMILICATVTGNYTIPVEAKEQQSGNRTVRVAFPSQGGMGEIGEGGDLVGYNYSYLQKIAEYAGWNIEYVTFEDQTSDEQIMSAMELVMSGEADLIGPMLQTDQVKEMFEFPKNNYGVVYTTLCATEKSNITSVNLDQFQPLKVAVYKEAASRNEEVAAYLKQMGIAYELLECETTEEQVQLITDGEADVLSSITLSYFDGTRAVAQFAPRPYYFVSTKGNLELIEELDAAIDSLNYTQPYAQDQLQEEFFGDTSGGYVLTEDEKEYMDKTNTLHVLCTSNYAPYCSKDVNGRKSGMLISLLNDFVARNNLKVDYSFCSNMEELEEEWQTGDYDCMIGLPFASDYCSQNGMIQTSPVISASIVLFGKKSMQKSPEESTVAIYDQLSDQIDLSDYKEVIECSTIDACYDAVENGSADYGCANRLGVDYKIIERNSSFVCTPLMGEQLDICIAVSQQHDIRLLSALNKYIHTLKDSKITSYLSEATKHTETQGLAGFVKTQPILATFFFTVMGLLVISSIMLALNSRRNKKRNIELEKANAAKSEFLSRMSHDIRTPLNAILGFSELGRQDIHSPEKVGEDLEKIDSSGKFLLGLVNDVLDMTKIESNAMELKLQPYNLNIFIKEMGILIGPLCIEKKITLTIDLADDGPYWVYADKLRLNQVFFNLLSNAVKYTGENGKIEVRSKVLSVEDEIAQMQFSVVDNGIGMSEEFQSHMFETFAQEQQHITGKEGIGLGLPIVKSLVELMDGTISVQSKKGVGSEFTVILPLKICDKPEEEKSENTFTYEGLKGRNVLLCEDHPLNTKLAQTILENAGVSVACAKDGKEGTEIFGNSREGFFDAILMDIRMPVMDGLEATRIIRKMDRTDARSIPIIAMTANAFDDDVEICKNAGMNEHLSKPFEVKQLYEILLQYISV